MPRYAPDHRAQTRGRILQAASRSSLQGGLAGVSVQGVMRDAGLTHGAFYAHFENRDALMAEALGAAAHAKLDQLLAHARGQAQPLRAFVRGYLSRSHRDQPEGGCPLPSLSAEVARAGGALRTTLADGLELLVDALVTLDPALSRSAAQTLVSSMVGALMLARAQPDPDRSDDFLRSVRQTLLLSLP